MGELQEQPEYAVLSPEDRVVVAHLRELATIARMTVARAGKSLSESDFKRVQVILRICGVPVVPLAEEIGVSPITFRRWERGKSLPEPEHFLTYAKICCASLEKHGVAYCGEQIPLNPLVSPTNK